MRPIPIYQMMDSATPELQAAVGAVMRKMAQAEGQRPRLPVSADENQRAIAGRAAAEARAALRGLPSVRASIEAAISDEWQTAREIAAGSGRRIESIQRELNRQASDGLIEMRAHRRGTASEYRRARR
jgi:hypothetical protein